MLSERAIARNEIIVRGRVIGGLQMIDAGEADDKIISVLQNDYVWGAARDIRDVPPVFVERLQHYFPDLQTRAGNAQASAHRQGHMDAFTPSEVVRAAMADYDDNVPDSRPSVREVR